MDVDSASNRASNEDSLQRARETYSNRESEETKKHKQEVKRLTEAHAQEVQKIEAEHTKNLNELKEKSKELITSHDMKYQKDINDLREMHQKQLSKTMQENDSKIKESEEASGGENQKTRQIGERQREQLIKNYETDLKVKDDRLSEAGKQSNEKLHDTTENIKKRITENYEKDLKLVNDDRDRRLTAEHDQFDRMRQAKDGQINQIARGKELDRNRLIKNFETDLGIEKDNRKIGDADLKDRFDDAVRKDQEKYKKALEAQSASSEIAREGIDGRITTRIDNEVKYLKASNQKLQEDGRRDLNSADRHKEIEIGHVVDDYQKKLNVSEKGRENFVEDMNKKKAHAFSDMNKKAADTLYAQTKYFKEAAGFDRARSQEAMNNKETDFETAISHTTAQNDVRFAKFKNSMETDSQKSKDYFEGSSKAMAENFDQRLDAVRMRNKEDQDKLFATFNKQAHENDRQFQEKMADVTMKYENEIVKLNDQHLKDMKELKTEGERRLKAQTKFDQEEIDKQKSQLEYRMAKVDESHKKDIAEINRRHEQTLAELSKVKGTNTKV